MIAHRELSERKDERERKLARPVTFAHKHVIKSDTPSRQIQSQFERDAAQDAEPGSLCSNRQTFAATLLYPGCHYSWVPRREERLKHTHTHQRRNQNCAGNKYRNV